MNDSYFIFSLFVFGMVMTITPGPNNIMLLSSGLNFGVRKSFSHALGIWVGNLVMLGIVGMGLGVLFTDYPIVHQLLKIASCIFLLFLAWKFGTTPPKSFDKEKKRSPLTFLQACSFQWVNPKAWIFAIGAIAAFSADNNFFTRIFIISLVLLITMIISTYAWLAGGCYLEKILKTARQQKIFNVSMGIILMVTVFTIIL